MIRNERQYRITKAQLEKFDDLMGSFSSAPQAGVHPRILQAQREAVQSQAEELREELAAYERLRQGTARVLELTSLDQLPASLIQARIAAGLTQRELADRLGMKEQQLQRYEATNYAAASLDRIRSVVAALNIKVREEIFMPGADISMTNVIRRAQSAGVSRDLVTKRISPRSGVSEDDSAAAINTASVLNRIFGWSSAVLFGEQPLAGSGAAFAAARFKLPKNAASRSTEAFATYAHYVAGLLVRATPTLAPTPIPTEAAPVRKAVRSRDGHLSFGSVLDYVWSLGVPVLPLADSGAFHGATWRFSGRNVIVIKQGVRHESRWTYDLLHELRHAAEEPDADDLAFIDYEELSRDNTSADAEIDASAFAGDVMLDGRAEQLVETCASEAGGSIERLKAVLPRVAGREGVSVAALANYMAFRLSLQGESWWGAATNLQSGNGDPWRLARDVALTHLDLARLDDVERRVLLRALEGDAP